jgi:hypothetical protein
MVGTFSGKKSLKALSNKVFRFIQQTIINETGFVARWIRFGKP